MQGTLIDDLYQHTAHCCLDACLQCVRAFSDYVVTFFLLSVGSLDTHQEGKKTIIYRELGALGELHGHGHALKIIYRKPHICNICPLILYRYAGYVLNIVYIAIGMPACIVWFCYACSWWFPDNFLVCSW